MCYVCKRWIIGHLNEEVKYRVNHKRREAINLCSYCVALNQLKKDKVCDFEGDVAIVTGGRIKIGFETALRLLRSGAEVIVTTRFPASCERKYKALEDFDVFKDRLCIFGVDMRSLSQVYAFVHEVKQRYNKVDILVNSAAQTVRKPPRFYKSLVDYEREANSFNNVMHTDGHLFHVIDF